MFKSPFSCFVACCRTVGTAPYGAAPARAYPKPWLAVPRLPRGTPIRGAAPPVRVRTAAACRLARVLVKGTIRTVMGTGTPTGSSPTSYPSLINKTVVRTGRSPTAWVRSNRRLTVFFPEGSFAVALSSALATLAARLPNG